MLSLWHPTFQTTLQGIIYSNEYYTPPQLLEKSTGPYVLPLHQGSYLPTPESPTDPALSFPISVGRGTPVK